jgi:hypothetical protein
MRVRRRTLSRQIIDRLPHSSLQQAGSISLLRKAPAWYLRVAPIFQCRRLCVRVQHFDQLAQGFRARFAHYGCAMTFDRPNRDI